MSAWIEDLAAAFELAPLSDAEAARLLDVARSVAHRVERKETPLAAFLIGLDVGSRAVAGGARDQALAAAIATVERLLPPAPSEAP